MPRPDSGLGFQVKFLETFHAVLFSLGSSGASTTSTAFRVWGSGCRASGVEFRASGVEFRISRQCRMSGSRLQRRFVQVLVSSFGLWVAKEAVTSSYRVERRGFEVWGVGHDCTIVQLDLKIPGKPQITPIPQTLKSEPSPARRR